MKQKTQGGTAAKIVPKSDAVQAAQKQSAGIKKSQAANAKAWKNSLPYLDSNFKGVGVVPYLKDKTFDPPKGGKKKHGNSGATPAQVLPAVVTSVAVGGQINPNVFEAYIAEIKRLTLKLVNSAKDLLLAYDFQSINSAVDYYLDTDNASKTYATIVKKAVPAPNFSPNQLTVQELTNNLVNTLAEYLSDTVEDNVKFNYFGSYVNGIWDPGTVSFQGNQPKYDLKVSIPVNSQIKNIQVSLYEI